MNDSE